MSTLHEKDNHSKSTSSNTIDLIDFSPNQSANNSSSSFTNNLSISSKTSEPNQDSIRICETLLDTELPKLEERLQQETRNVDAYKQAFVNPVIDVEDILISLDDPVNEHEHFDQNSCRTAKIYESAVKNEVELKKSYHDLFKPNESLEISNQHFPLVEHNSTSSVSSRRSREDHNSNELNLQQLFEDRFTKYPCTTVDVTDSNSDAIADIIQNDSEALELIQALQDLDNILDTEQDDNPTLQSLEECLQDLDDYLQAFDDSEESSISSDLSVVSENFNSSECVSDNEGLTRERLQRIEQNYAKFLHYGCVNRGFEFDCEGRESTRDSAHVRRPSSACENVKGSERRRNGNMKRRRLERATISVINRQRPSNIFPANTATSRNPPTNIQCIQQTSVDNTNCCNGVCNAEDDHRIETTLPRAENNENCIVTSGQMQPMHFCHAGCCSYESGNCSISTTVVPNGTVATKFEQETSIIQKDPQTVEHLQTNTATPSEALTSTQQNTTDEIPLGRSLFPSSSAQHSHEEEHVESTESGSPNKLSNAYSWMRNSMRNLQEIPDLLLGQTPRTLSTNDSIVSDDSRPLSAPSRLPTIVAPSSRSRSRSHVSGEPSGRTRSSSGSSHSHPPRSLSSSVTSLESSVDLSSQINLPRTAGTDTNAQNGTESQRNRPCDNYVAAPDNTTMPTAQSPLGYWPHSLSSTLACLSCTLGLFNISRFAMLTIYFGANFVFQFMFLTLIFGLPMYTLQLCLGQQLAAGVIDMWRISPLFQGVGVALLFAQALTGLYSIIGTSWMFVYFRDSFVTRLDRYRWAEPFFYFRPVIQAPINGTYKLPETVPDYFNGVVLQRHHLPSGKAYGTIKFQSAFNLAIVWLIIFVSLTKGLRSYGKVIFAFMIIPIFGTLILCTKIFGLMPPEYVNVILPETSWDEFFMNSKSWLAAAQETFLTWGLLGAAIMQISSHNKHKHLLQRDSSLVIIVTVIILLLMAFMANTCVQILKSYGYVYVPDSFESMSSYQFLRSTKDRLPPSLSNLAVRDMVHNSFILGEKVVRPGSDHTTESGYQVLRFATELFPATVAVLGTEAVSPFWAVLFYFVLIMFGICQQLAIWHCVITGIMAIDFKTLRPWETTITFFSCACGFVLGLPMATELGIYVVYFMDYTIGAIWWLAIVFLIQIVAVFMVRGRPYSGDTIVTALFLRCRQNCFLSWAPAMLSFTWNVILPVALMALCISTFKNGSFRDMFIWHHAPAADYWPLWARQIGSMLQLVPILVIPFVAVIQSYRYLNDGPNDILERIQLLYRPPLGEHMEDPPPTVQATSPNAASAIPPTVVDDSPPKYTPPPSYTTATGARLANFLRQSIRRSVRRIASVLGEGSSNSAARSTRIATITRTRPPPPEYCSVVVGENRSDVPQQPQQMSTLERLRSLQSSPTALTAAEVASILRSSFRRSTAARSRLPTNLPNNEESVAGTSLSAENLIESASPIAETSLVIEISENNNTKIVI